ncbi:LEAF RUST 10 DISEASE-RESISTANCE LOCUS RECEPTOR-LIKE PROTEIN KINASE-like 2.8 [Juglans microcarpa x Juglans regia]|uniref:LEAF RUST 10 DISEASE-RESISTANCE LOCUS RECEPTOR-LIKE PROTEIN KINASE-like 2.8 n=1 Tax=Juglans microcarpa x Juglans regia TaxID=2249226 RepID=UPI001B7F4126|nr:LEAF RUST 10 DISEASE-RESISTANCE LOCUS RECEPTOR-LIKE PROTEIN KINASE-like 2.8 [Juglans microcarpa x Juglans regia]
MARGMAFPAELRVLITTVLVLILVPPASSLKNTDQSCPPSSCGNIPNISYPFRLKGDPPNCGDQRYELSCDDNNHTLLSLNGSKYYVSQINYNNYTIRIVDSGIQEDNYSFIPRYFLNSGNFTWPEWYISGFTEVVIVNCEKPVSSASPFHLKTTSTNCSNINNGYGSSSNSSFSQDSKRYLYLIVGGANVMDVEESCTIEQISLATWPGQISADSCTDIRNVFSYGFEVSWYRIYCGSCGSYRYCSIDEDNDQVSCKRLLGNIPPWVFFLAEQVRSAGEFSIPIYKMCFYYYLRMNINIILYLLIKLHQRRERTQDGQSSI